MDQQSSVPETKSPEPDPNTPPIPFVPEVGDWVSIIFWRYWPGAGLPNNGEWQIDTVRVVSVGSRQLCYETASTGSNGDTGSLDSSKLRMIPLDRVFETYQDAQKAILITKPPGT